MCFFFLKGNKRLVQDLTANWTQQVLTLIRRLSDSPQSSKSEAPIHYPRSPDLDPSPVFLLHLTTPSIYCLQTFAWVVPSALNTLPPSQAQLRMAPSTSSSWPDCCSGGQEAQLWPPCCLPWLCSTGLISRQPHLQGIIQLTQDGKAEIKRLFWV